MQTIFYFVVERNEIQRSFQEIKELIMNSIFFIPILRENDEQTDEIKNVHTD